MRRDTPWCIALPLYRRVRSDWGASWSATGARGVHASDIGVWCMHAGAERKYVDIRASIATHLWFMSTQLFHSHSNTMQPLLVLPPRATNRARVTVCRIYKRPLLTRRLDLQTPPCYCCRAEPISHWCHAARQWYQHASLGTLRQRHFSAATDAATGPRRIATLSDAVSYCSDDVVMAKTSSKSPEQKTRQQYHRAGRSVVCIRKCNEARRELSDDSWTETTVE